MIPNDQIAEIVKEGVRAVLPSAKISRVKVGEDIGGAGELAMLEIMVVFSNRQTVTLKGEDFLSLYDAVQQRLLNAGETRYPFLRYVGERELRGTVS